MNAKLSAEQKSTLPKPKGQLDYEADLRRAPFYPDGERRPTWDELRPWAKDSWERPIHHE